MKKIGLVGGLGPASTVVYYQGLIGRCRAEYGEDVYPRILIDSVNMAEHTKALAKGDLVGLGELLLESLHHLKGGGADLAAVTANTEHIVWDLVQERFPLPVVSILDAVADRIVQKGYRRVLVFGTEETLRSGLYERVLRQRGITAVIPAPKDIRTIGRLIYPNLENGVVIPKDKAQLLALANYYIRTQRVDAFLLGCTELPLAIRQEEVSVPLLDSTQIHVERIYELANERGAGQETHCFGQEESIP